MERRLVAMDVRTFVAPSYINALAQSDESWRTDVIDACCGWFVQSTLN